jgi:membrane-associated phospholipid phosphatase
MLSPGRSRSGSAFSRFVAARLSPEGAMGLHFTVGLAVIVVAALAFDVVAHDVVSGAAITRLDAQIAAWFHAHATPGFTRAMLLLTHANGLAGTGVMAALLAVWFAVRKDYHWLLVTLVAVPGGMLLNVFLKGLFQRHRPTFDDPLLTLATYSFPSGHTAAATVFYGLLACWVVRHVPRTGTRALAVAAAAVLIALVAVSRMYLGVHYLSDVLAAFAEGCAWLATCIMAVSALQRRRQARRAHTDNAEVHP